jgi:hypothetical protein
LKQRLHWGRPKVVPSSWIRYTHREANEDTLIKCDCPKNIATFADKFISMPTRDDFDSKTVTILAKRASYICSNPACRCITLGASDAEKDKFIYTGKAAHITAASAGGPRYDSSLTSAQRGDISNAIFLCSSCAEMIDKNGGADFTVDLLKDWKESHEKWTKENLNKSPNNSLVVIDGVHHAEGNGTVTALEIRGPALLKPGTISRASGTGNITATKIN